MITKADTCRKYVPPKLYVVTEAGADAPQLHPVQNPAARFRMGEGIFATGFIIHEDTWRERVTNES